MLLEELKIGKHYIWNYGEVIRIITIKTIYHSECITVYVFNNPELIYSTTLECIKREPTPKELLLADEKQGALFAPWLPRRK